MSFVENYVKFTKELESPESFWRWASYVAVAATVRDYAFFDGGLRKIYPNMYVLFLAKSAENRKSGPFSSIASLLLDDRSRSTKVFQGRASVQGIYDLLSRTLNTGSVSLAGGSCLILAEELAAFFVQDDSLIQMMTDMYDPREVFEYSLRSTGTIKIKNLCVSLLGASNKQLLQKVYSGDAVYGGLLSRTLIITPNETRPPNDLMDMGFMDLKPLVEELREIRDKAIEAKTFTITESGKLFYREWYHKLYNSYSSQQDPTGVLQRLHTHAFKLGMVLAASEQRFTITDHDISEAIEQVTALRGNYKEFEISSGQHKNANIAAMLLTHLSKCKDFTCTRKEFLGIHWMDVELEEFDKLISTMDAAGILDVTLGGQARTTYTLTKKAIEKFKGEK